MEWYTNEIVTYDMSERKKPGPGGWKRKALAYLGVSWPPEKGWRAKIIGLPREPLP